MANTRRRVNKDTKATQTKSYKFANFQKEADAKRAKAAPPPEFPPFVIDDITPEIRITAPDTLERMLVIGDYIGMWRSGNWDTSASLPLLRALCGNQFGRVWMLIKDDPDPNTMLAMINAMFEHFSEVIEPVQEAEELPGGSEDSSD